MTTWTRPRTILGTWDIPSWASGSSQTLPARCGEDVTAVRVPADLARPALTALGPRTGPVLANHTTRTWFFLLPPHTTLPDGWPYGVRVMPQGRPTGIPPLTTTGGRDIHWAVLPGRGFTSPTDLHRVLNDPRVLATPATPAPAEPSAAPAPPARAAAPVEPRPSGKSHGSCSPGPRTHRSPRNWAGQSGPSASTCTRSAAASAPRPPPAGPLPCSRAATHPRPRSRCSPPDDLAVLRVLAGLATDDALPDELRPPGRFLDRVDELRERCGARTDPHLIALAAFWELLPDLVNPASAPGKEQLP
ncbi:hypothetical protein [Streptomyces bacillaris]|uniref:hypothetical protein n=1 Tax=Streptomyces bacillaris TaxID=68179 RepID=UPI00362F9869